MLTLQTMRIHYTELQKQSAGWLPAPRKAGGAGILTLPGALIQQRQWQHTEHVTWDFGRSTVSDKGKGGGDTAQQEGDAGSPSHRVSLGDTCLLVLGMARVSSNEDYHNIIKLGSCCDTSILLKFSYSGWHSLTQDLLARPVKNVCSFSLRLLILKQKNFYKTPTHCFRKGKDLGQKLQILGHNQTGPFMSGMLDLHGSKYLQTQSCACISLPQCMLSNSSTAQNTCFFGIVVAIYDSGLLFEPACLRDGQFPQLPPKKTFREQGKRSRQRHLRNLDKW